MPNSQTSGCCVKDSSLTWATVGQLSVGEATTLNTSLRAAVAWADLHMVSCRVSGGVWIVWAGGVKAGFIVVVGSGLHEGIGSRAARAANQCHTAMAPPRAHPANIIFGNPPLALKIMKSKERMLTRSLTPIDTKIPHKLMHRNGNTYRHNKWHSPTTT